MVAPDDPFSPARAVSSNQKWVLPDRSPRSSPLQLFFGGPDRTPKALRDLLEQRIDEVPPGGTIDWATYYFRDLALARALIRAHRRGVKVQVVLEGWPRLRRANEAVIALLRDPKSGIGEGLKVVGGMLPMHMHLKIYCFSAPRAAAFIGSFNPSGNQPEDPEVIREIGDQDRGHNLLLEVRDALAVAHLRGRVHELHERGRRSWWRGLRDHEFRSGGLEILFFPHANNVLIHRLKNLGPGSTLRIAASHLRDGAIVSLLARLVARGVQVSVITGHTRRRTPHRIERYLRRHKVPVQRYCHPDGLPMHCKFILAEDHGQRWSAFGSFNLTRSSRWINQELLAFTDDHSVCDGLEERWKDIAAECRQQQEPAESVEREGSRRLALLLHDLGAGGAQRRVVWLANRFVELGRAVDLLVWKDEGSLKDRLDPAVRVVALSREENARGRGGRAAALARYLRREAPYVLMAGANKVHAAAVRGRELAGNRVPLVLRVSNHAPTVPLRRAPRMWVRGRVRRWRAERLYRQADALVAVSQNIANWIAAGVGGDRPMTSVINNPTVTEALLKQERPRPGRNEEHPPIVLGVGRFFLQKDFETLLRAFALVRTARPARLVLLGDGPRRSRLEEIARSLGLDGDVTMPGWSDDVRGWLERADLLVSSSLWEGSPGVIIEALAAGCPVVATDCPGGSREVLQDGKLGPLVRPGDSPGMAKAILSVLATPPPSDQLKAGAAPFCEEGKAEAYLKIFDEIATAAHKR